MGPPRPDETRLDVREVELQGVRVLHRGAACAEQSLLLHVRLDECDLLLGAAREREVAEGLFVHGEEAHRGAILGRHVADRGAVRDGECGDARPVELHELPHDAHFAEHLGDGENQVGRGRALGEPPGEAESHDLGDQHRHRLAEHGGFGLDAAHAPAEHAEAVDHRGVRVGADEGVGVDLRDRPLAPWRLGVL